MLKCWEEYTDEEIYRYLHDAVATLNMEIRLPWPIARAIFDRLSRHHQQMLAKKNPEK